MNSNRSRFLMGLTFLLILAGLSTVWAEKPAGASSLFDGRRLGGWQVADYLGSGRVYVRDGAIVLEKGVEQTGAQWAGDVLRSNYEIELEAMRVEGEDFFCGLTFPVKQSYCSLIVGGWRGKVVGLSCVDLEDAAENETTVLMEFEKGKWYPIRLRVTDDKIIVWIEGDKVIDVPIRGRIIDTRTEVEECKPLGIMSWKTTAAVRNIYMRPVTSETIVKVRHVSEMSKAERTALAKKILGNNNFPKVLAKGEKIIKSGFDAGDGYGQVWIRDFNTFIELSCEVNDREVVRKNLLRFFDYQGDDGNIVDGFVAKTGKTHKNTVETDQETSLIQAVYKYVKVTGDEAVLSQKIKGKTVSERLSMAMDFLMKHRYSKKYGLLWGATTADWGDVEPRDSWGVYLSDKTEKAIDIYDNAMFVIALSNYLELIGADSKQAERWKPVLNQMRNNVRMHLWTGSKFVPHIYLDKSPWPKDFNEQVIYYQGGTGVAIEAGVLDRDEMAISFEAMIDNRIRANAQSIGLTLYPTYPKGFFNNPQMANPYSYQNGGDWTWFGARIIQQMVRHGFVESAYNELLPMTDRVVKNKGFFEWYTVDGKPRGSGTFRGSAGVLDKSIKMLTEWALKETGN